MAQKYVALPSKGKLVKCKRLSFQKAHEVAQTVQSGLLNWVVLIECYQHRGKHTDSANTKIFAESVVFDVEVELPQRPVHPIRRIERIAVTFTADDRNYPEVYALREDFPQVSHLNLREFIIPRSLCLYDEPYSEIKLRWTAPEFIERVRSWLAETATGELHKNDQALEPLLLGSAGTIILPSQLHSSSSTHVREKIEVFRIDDGTTGLCLIAVKDDDPFREHLHEKRHPPFVTLFLRGIPQQHGIIHRQPTNLIELHQFLEAAQIDLLAEMRKAFVEWQMDISIVNAGLILLVVLPKTRVQGGQKEASDVWAFLCVSRDNKENVFPNVKQIGEQIGLWQISNGTLGTLIPPDLAKNGEQVGVLILNPCSKLSRELAAKYNGLTKREDRRIAAIGLGALGSQVFLNLLRAGYGEWILIDNDHLLPHNLARHALFGSIEGLPKAKAAALIANQTIDGAPIASAIVIDVLEPDGEHIAALSNANVILDCSASIAVARHIAQDVNSSARRVSLFLNPTGNDLVLLAEDSSRNISLFSLEAQYYRLLLTEPALEEHLSAPTGRTRYARACRDLSSNILQEQVALSAAIGSRAFRAAIDQDDATVAIWQSDKYGNVRKLAAKAQVPVIHQIGEWTIFTDEIVIEKVRRWRSNHLPNETGGILIGCYDMQRKYIYVATALPSPSDSQEEPTGYIRGTSGLKQEIEKIKRITAGNLHYVGEWHSHPTGYGVRMSGADLNLLAWLSEQMTAHGKPSLMLIVGEGKVSWNVGQIGG